MTNPENISEYFDEYIRSEISEEQFRKLESALREDDELRAKFIEYLNVDSALGELAALSSSEIEVIDSHPSLAFESTTLKDSNLAAPRRRNRYLGTISILVTCLVVVLGIFYFDSPNNEQQKVVDRNRNEKPVGETPFATVAQVIDVQWGESPALKIGDRLTNSKIQFQSGFLKLAFDDGVEVTLQGPAQYELLEHGKTKLKNGLLTANVPPGAEGFTVDTPTAEVVDLGTSFGINLQDDGIPQVSVFEGEVEITITNDASKQLLKEGESIRVEAGKEIQAVDFDPETYSKVWPISSGIVGSSESIRFIPPWPRRIRFIKSDESIFVAPEGPAVELDQPLRVNISRPGDYKTVDQLTPAEFESGQRVRSYFLHFHPTENLPPRDAVRVKGSITFDRPILGLIVRHEELKASMRRFTPRAIGEELPWRQLSLNDRFAGDRISLSEDMRTVTLDVSAPKKTSDLVRVIVESDHHFENHSPRFSRQKNRVGQR